MYKLDITFQASKIVYLQLSDPQQFDKEYPLVIYNGDSFDLYGLAKKDKKFLHLKKTIYKTSSNEINNIEFHSGFSYDIKSHIALFSEKDSLIFDIKQNQIT